ncbi:hypothetical protein SLS57_005245 [Botryosphaeria dothidea]
MDVFYSYTYGTAAWFTVQAAPLIGSPTMIAALLSPQVREATTGAATTDPEDPKAPYALPTLTVTTVYHAAAAFYMYAMWNGEGVSSFALGMVGSTVLAAVGLWCILFASSDGRISRKTGADKRTSGFPFKNNEADKRKAKKAH